MKWQKKISPIGIWDYNLRFLDFSRPETIKWYLRRKIEYNDWKAIDYRMLKKYLYELDDIDQDKKTMLENFIRDNENFKFSAKTNS